MAKAKARKKRKLRSFVVTYRMVGAMQTESEYVDADDEGCALGCVLDDLDDDDRFEWFHIRDLSSPLTDAAHVPGAVDQLPAEVQRAYEAALVEAL